MDEVMREIERHRGARPKASMTLLFNRVLSALARERYDRDPTAQLLRRYAAGAIAPAPAGPLQLGVIIDSESGRR
jgi:hypothetical protein